MSSSITATPISGAVISQLDRPQRERERRKREMDAFKALRSALEYADRKALWRMEKIDITKGAIYLIQKMTGVPVPARPPISLDDYPRRNLEDGERMSRVNVERRRRANESDAIHNLRELLMKHGRAHRRMEKLDVLYAAISFIKSLAESTRTSTESGRSASGSPASSTTTESTSSPETAAASSRTPSPVTPIVYSPFTPAWNPQQMLLAAMMQPMPFLPISMPSLFPIPTFHFNDETINEPAPKKAKTDIWRPFE